MRLIDANYLLDVLLVHNWHGNNKNIVPYKDRKGYRQRDAEVREAIINAPNVAVVVDRKNKGEWIPVSERNPDIYKRVEKYLITDNAEQVRTAYFANSGEACWWTYPNVIAWQPLPEPYKAESEDKE